MLVLRSTMDAAVEAERARYRDLAERFGGALERTGALQYQLAAWVYRDAEAFTPEQFAQMFYARDDRFQAAVFNCLPTVVAAVHDARPPARPGEYQGIVGVPAGDGQWAWVAYHIDDDGFATLESLYEHAKAFRERKQTA